MPQFICISITLICFFLEVGSVLKVRLKLTNPRPRVIWSTEQARNPNTDFFFKLNWMYHKSQKLKKPFFYVTSIESQMKKSWKLQFLILIWKNNKRKTMMAKMKNEIIGKIDLEIFSYCVKCENDWKRWKKKHWRFSKYLMMVA